MLLAALVIVLHGLFGPQLSPKNLATLGIWVHYRGLLVVVLLAVGNVFCMGCPLLLPRALARRLKQPVRNLPRWMRNKWLATGLFAGVLFAYELFDLWASPLWTAILVLGFFAAAFAVDAFFKHAPFCKYVCPIGQFNFLASTLSPFEVKVSDTSVCASCTTADCIRGRRAEDDREKIVQRGCELALYLPRKVGNLDCTFCLDCVHACPHDNVAIAARLPGEELCEDPRRSGVGRLSERRDLATLALLFTFGALLNAFGMVRPVYAFQSWLAGLLGTQSEGLVLALLFLLGLVALPVALLLPVAALSRTLGRSKASLVQLVTPFAYALLPMGLGVWAAHYAFHFLTGLWTIVPVAQSAAESIGVPLGDPQWGRGGFTAATVKPVELGLLLLGLAGSLGVAARIAWRELPRPRLGLAPWGVLLAALFASALWLLAQPMEMRGTFL